MGSRTGRRRQHAAMGTTGGTTSGDSAAALDGNWDAEFERDQAELERSSRVLTRVLLFVFLGVAALMVVIAILTGISTSRKLGREQSALGQVTGMTERKDEQGNSYFYPVVAFDVPDGGRYRVQLAEGSWPPSHRVGDLVTVRYDGLDPMDARIQTGGGAASLWIWTLVTGILGVAFLGAAALAWFLGRQ